MIFFPWSPFAPVVMDVLMRVDFPPPLAPIMVMSRELQWISSILSRMMSMPVLANSLSLFLNNASAEIVKMLHVNNIFL